MGGQFNYSDFSKKSDELKNYVEITPEMQAEVEAAKKAAEKAELQGGLNGNKGKDLTKGVTVDGVKPLSNEELAARYGEIREADPSWKRLLNNAYYHSKNFLKKLGEAIIGGGALVLGGAAAVLSLPAACTKEDNLLLPDIDTNVSVTYNPKSYDVVNNRCNILNMDDEAFDDAVNANDMLRDSDKARLTSLDFSRQTSDGIKFNYGAEKLNDGTGRAYINVPEGQNGLKLYLDSSSQIPAGDVLKYIDVLNPDLECDGEKLHFEEKNGNPQVVVENGFTHQIGDMTEVKDGSALGNLNKMISTMGFESVNDKVATIGGNTLLMDCRVSRGEYSNEQNSFDEDPNFAFELVERGDLGNITNGNPKVNFKIFDQQVTGQLFNENGATVIKDENGKELARLTQKQNYDIGTEDYADLYDGILVEVDGKEFAFISDGLMGVIDRTDGTFMTSYKQASEGFDISGIKKADDFYNEKEHNLNKARSTALTNYNALFEIFRANADAEANIHIG